MYITPRTDIRLLSGCPCDPEYVHTLYFAGEYAQRSYFMGLTKKNLNGYTYQRYAKNKLRVQILADELYDVNYMMFKNTAYGDKWFYAFVDKVEYINDVTTEIVYHLDDIQTWLFDFQLNQCFIERMHTITDNIGDNIIPEPVEVGEYVNNGDYHLVPKYMFGNGNAVVIIAITEVNGTSYAADGNIYDGIYSACKLYAYSATSNYVQNINNWITAYSQSPDSIVSIYMAPRDVIPDPQNNINTDHPINFNSSGKSDEYTIGDCGTKLNGYRPKNKKLFTYPYNFCAVNNSDGNNLSLRYEFFNNNTAKLEFMSSLSQPVQVVCSPKGYKYTYNYDEPYQYEPFNSNINERLVLTGYPMCSWNIDAWKAWIAQNSMPLLINAGAAVSSLALAAYTPASTTTSSIVGASGQPLTAETPASFNFSTNASIYAIHQISTILTNMYKASIAADITKGNISSGTAAQASNMYGIWVGRMSVNAQQAEIIDNFFSRYGYAINKVDTPQIHTRTEWTYIKTVDCTCHGSIPVDSEKNIENIFNSGITFWVNPAHVGDYRYDNVPLQ